MDKASDYESGDPGFESHVYLLSEGTENIKVSSNKQHMFRCADISSVVQSTTSNGRLVGMLVRWWFNAWALPGIDVGYRPCSVARAAA